MTGIRVSHVSKRFESVRVLSDISFDVAPGSFCTLLGPSGCGKTTLLRLIAGLDRPDAGEIWYGSKLQSSDHHFTPPQARRVGYVFQAYALWPHMRVFDQIAYPLRVRRETRSAIVAKVERVVETVGLSPQIRRFPSELSGGQQQRVALARALVIDPAALLLDEPLSNLDAELRQEMRLELQDLHRRLGVTTIYVTHDQVEAMALSDSVIVLDSGRLVEIGTPRLISETPQNAYTAKFVGAANFIEGRVDIHPDGTMGVRLLECDVVLKGVGAGEFAVGQPAVVALKPEDIIVQAGTTTDENSINAVVENTTYLGSHVMVQMRFGNSLIRVHQSKQSALRSGDEVTLILPPETVRYFRLNDPSMDGRDRLSAN